MVTMTPLPRTTVLGLGPMGRAVAATLLSADVPTTVWNRTPGRAHELDGAVEAPTPEAAAAEAELVLAVLRDHDATRAVLAGIGAEALSGRTVVNLASATPEEARATARWAQQQGITLLNGAIMSPTPLIGTPRGQILYSGPADLIERHRPALEVLAGQTEHVGDDPGLAAVLDTAMLEIFFAGMTSFLHAAALVTAQGIDATTFLPRAREILDLLPDTFDGLAKDVDAGQYPGHEDRVAMNLAALEHITTAGQELELDSRLPAAMRDLGRRAVDAGYGDHGWSSIVEVMRRGA